MSHHPQRYRPFAGGYVSEFEQFMGQFLAQRPQVQQDQKRGWYIYWDHRVDRDELEKQREEAVLHKPPRHE